VLHVSRWAVFVGALALDPVGVRGTVSRTPVPGSLVASHAWLHSGTPDIKAAGALTFTADGLLLVGDSPSSAVFALDVRDAATVVDTINVKGIDELVAARLVPRHPRSRSTTSPFIQSRTLFICPSRADSAQGRDR